VCGRQGCVRGIWIVWSSVVGRRSSVTSIRFRHPVVSMWVLMSMDDPIALFTVRVLRHEKAEKRHETDRCSDIVSLLALASRSRSLRPHHDVHRSQRDLFWARKWRSGTRSNPLSTQLRGCVRILQGRCMNGLD
jgi:hypothetical protein